MKLNRSCLILVAVHLNLLLFGQPINRLVVLANSDLSNPTLQIQTLALETDFRQLFGVTDIHVISVRPENRTSENDVSTIEEGLVRMRELCQDPAFVTVVAFVFFENTGPTFSQVAETLDGTQNQIKILANAYFRNTLSDFTCTRYAILDYSRGSVKSRDSIETEDPKFPIIPVVAGGVVVGTGIVLLTGSGGDECDPVDPTWQVPGGLCSDDAPVQLVVSGTTGGTWSGTGVSANGIFNPSSGTETITYTVGEGSCQASRTQSIDVGVVDASWSDPSDPCVGETVVLLAITPGGTWSGAGVIQNPNGTANFSQTSAGSYNVTYTLDIGACSDEVTHTITVLADADASWTLPEALCEGLFVELIPTGTAGGQWTGDGVNDHGNGTASFSSNTPGSYSITYTAGTGECVASLTQQIDVTQSPDASWIAPKSAGCVGEQFLLTPSGTSGGSWSGPGVTDHGDGTATFSHDVPGTYSISYTVTLDQCTASSSQDITVISQADPSWMTPGDVCSGTSYTLNPTGTPGGIWAGQGVSDQGNGTAMFISNDAGTFAVTYTAGTGACETSLTLEITVIQSPVASWSPPSNALCSGDAFELIPTGTQGGIWTGNGVTDHGNGTATFSETIAGSYEVTYTVMNGPCSNSSVQVITVVTQPDASWTAPSDICEEDQVTLVPNGTMGGTWAGSGVTDLGNGTALFNPTEAGIYIIGYTIGQGSCETFLEMPVEVLPLPDAGWNIPVGVCSGQIVTLTPAGTIGGTWTGEGITDLGDGTANFSQQNPGLYLVTYSISAGPCSSVFSQTIEVFSQPDPSWTAPTDVCTGNEEILVATGTGGGTWTGPAITDLGNGMAVFAPTAAGSYNIIYTIVQGPCEASLSLPIEVFLLPDATWNLPDGICTDQTVTLVPEGTPGGIWSGDGVTDLGNGTATFTQPASGVYSITYTVINGPCIAALTQDVQVIDQPDPDWTLPSDVCTGQEVLLVPVGTSGGTWSGPGVTDLGNGTANFIQNLDGSYTVTYTVGQGTCAQSLSQDIIVDLAGDPSWTPPSDVICPGNNIELVADEGTWSGVGVTDLGGGLGEFQTFNSGFYTITLTVGSGNCEASESHDVEVGDLDSPVIEIPASDMTVTCDGNGNITELQDWLDSFGGAEASDLCSQIITWEHDFTDFPFDCGMAGAVTVIFTATDDAGNTASTVGTFTIEDLEPPTFSGVPADVVVPCDAIPPPAPVIATDDCSGNAAVAFEELPPGTSCPYEIVRIWTATDACGNAVSIQQTLTATDNQAPVPVSLPHDTIIICPGPPEQCIPPPVPVPFTDNCDSDPTVVLMEQIQPLPPNGLIVTRCWTATDDCGNASPPICHNIIINSLETIASGDPPQILLTLSSLPGNTIEEQLDELFVPGNTHWQDPGLIAPTHDAYTQSYSVNRMPPLSLQIQIPIQSGITLYAGGALRKADLFKKFAGYDHALFSGILTHQTYDVGLRFIPGNAKHVFFFSGLRYARYNISDMKLTTANSIAVSASTMRAFDFSHMLGVGASFTLGDIGTWEIKTDYGAYGDGGIFSDLKINMSSLMQSLRKHQQ